MSAAPRARRMGRRVAEENDISGVGVFNTSDTGEIEKIRRFLPRRNAVRGIWFCETAHIAPRYGPFRIVI